MKPDEIEIGKTYRMRGRMLDRRVDDIIWIARTNSDGSYGGEYRIVKLSVPDGTPGGVYKTTEYLDRFAGAVVRGR